jgi:tetraacyldisaccharide 4'-kinase
MRIVDQAQALDATPVTTEKDAVRLPPEARGMVDVLSVHLVWREPDAVAALLAAHLPPIEPQADRKTG